MTKQHLNKKDASNSKGLTIHNKQATTEKEVSKLNKKKPLPKYADEKGHNTPRNPPRFPRKTKIIFQSVITPFARMNGNFTTKTGIDDFRFFCKDCENQQADVLEVYAFPNAQDTDLKIELYTLRFSVGCPKCGKTGKLEIHLRPNITIGSAPA